jgi:hypothetical protein
MPSQCTLLQARLGSDETFRPSAEARAVTRGWQRLARELLDLALCADAQVNELRLDRAIVQKVRCRRFEATRDRFERRGHAQRVFGPLEKEPRVCSRVDGREEADDFIE